MKHYLFEVVGKREYRGHRPGEQFITRMDPALERALERPNVVIVAVIDPKIQEGQYGLPQDWPTIAPADATVTERGGTK